MTRNLIRWMIVLVALVRMAGTVQAEPLHIYCENDPPMQFLGPDGQLTGMSVEMVRDLQRRVGNTDPILLVPWARGYEWVSREPNTILFSMARTAERNDQFQWVGPISESAFGLYVRADSTLVIRTLDDARKVRAIGVHRDDVRDQFLTRAGFTNLERTTDNISNIKKLMSGRIDLYASSSNDIKGYAEYAGYKLSDVRLAFVFLRSQIYIAFSRGTDRSVVLRWQNALKDMKRDGSFKAIFRKYYPDRELPGPEVLPSLP